MSEISSRPRVHSVSGAASEAMLKQGAVLLASIVAGLLGSLPKLARQAHNSIRAARAAGILPVGRLAEARLFQENAQEKLASTGPAALETARVEALLEIATTPYYVHDAKLAREALGRMSMASSLSQLARARDECVRTIESSHNVVLANALVTACSRACLKIGFDRLDVRERGSLTRVIATNPAGKTLVTEISAGVSPKVETEVVGVSDSSCHAILDAFDAALEAEGVRSAPPRRKFTGGVCELAAAREFLRQKVQAAAPARRAVQEQESHEQARRRQRLNQKAAQIQRRG